MKIKYLFVALLIAFANSKSMQNNQISPEEYIELLLQNPYADVNQKIPIINESPIVFACKKNMYEALIKLIKRKAHLHKLNDYGENILHICACDEYGKNAQCLLDLVNKKDACSMLKERTKSGSSPLDIALTLGFIEPAKIFLEHGTQITTNNMHNLFATAQQTDIFLQLIIMLSSFDLRMSHMKAAFDYLNEKYVESEHFKALYNILVRIQQRVIFKHYCKKYLNKKSFFKYFPAEIMHELQCFIIENEIPKVDYKKIK